MNIPIEIEAFKPHIELTKTAIERLDAISNEKPYFDYDLYGLDFLFNENKIKTKLFLECNLKQTSGDESIKVMFNGAAHGYLNLEATDKEVKHTLEAQEFIRCSSASVADKVGEVLKGISKQRVMDDYIIEIMGDYLRFDRHNDNYRGWTGGYETGYPDISFYKQTHTKNKEWQKTDILYNLDMRLDALYFLSNLISEQTGFKALEDYENKVPAEKRLQNIVDNIDISRYKLIHDIKTFYESEGKPYSMEMSTNGSCSVESDEKYPRVSFPGEESRLFFVWNQGSRFIRHLEKIHPDSGQNMIDAYHRMGISNRHEMVYKGMQIMLIDSTSSDTRGVGGLEIMGERWNVDEYSFSDFKRDDAIMQEVKRSILRQKI